MKKTASKDIIKFNALLRELYPQNHAEAKEGILSGYGVESTLDLTPEQLTEVVNALQTEKAKRKEEPAREIRLARSKCLGLMDEIGVPANWPARNAFCEKPNVLNGKRLYDLDKGALDAFAKKLYAIKAEVKRRQEDEKYWSSNN
jgi:hypothetical protein